MGTKRKAEDEVLEIPSDDDEDSDSDVQIQEKPIPIVTVLDDDDDEQMLPPRQQLEPISSTSTINTSVASSSSGNTSHSSTACSSSSLFSSGSEKNSSKDPQEVTPPPAPIISNQSVSCQTSKAEEEKLPDCEKKDENLLLSMNFRDQELFQLFRGSLTEYLKTTFQLKLSGQEVDVLHEVETACIRVMKKPQSDEVAPTAPTAPEPSTPTSNKVPPAEAAPTTPVATDPQKSAPAPVDDGMFVIDSTPAKSAKGGPIVPSYKKALQKVLDGSPSATAEGATKRPKPKQLCWNCDGDHGLRDCKEPRNFAKINKMKQEFLKKTDRYHVDLEQKYGHIVPGRLTDDLRQALGLKKRDLPMHVYRMRLFGYPPGWLEEAKITHSGLQLFDSKGAPVQDSDESDGEVDNVRMKYDVRKIISFPGFNVDAGGDFHDDSRYYGVPPRMGHQSRDEMIRNLEGTLVQGYRRKKLRLATASSQPDAELDAADMELDNPEETFVTVDSVGMCDKLEGDAPPVSQSSSQTSINGKGSVSKPAFSSAAEDEEEPEEGEVDDEGEVIQPQKEEKDEVKEEKEKDADANGGNDDSGQDDSVILVEEETEVICLDDSRIRSPSLDDLRRKQQDLLKQLEAQSPSVQNNSIDISNEDSLLEDVLMAERLAEEQEENENNAATPALIPPTTTANPLLLPVHCIVPVPLMMAPPPPLPPPPTDSEAVERPPEPEFLNLDEIKMSKTPFIDDPASMGLKKMSLGTPILTPFTPFNTLPSGKAFSVGVSDVINFENLPNSTGKYERMKSLLSKVRTVITAHNGEVDEDEDELR